MAGGQFSSTYILVLYLYRQILVAYKYVFPLIKAEISNVMCTRCFWNNIHQVRPKYKNGKLDNLYFFGSMKSRGQRLVKVTDGVEPLFEY
jgi:hypothetical protein